MDRKAVSMALVDLFAAVIIIVAIAGFYFAFKISNNAMQVNIRDNMKTSELDTILITYLRIPTEYKGANMTNAEKIIAMIYDGSIKDYKEPYIREYLQRTGYCIEYISLYKGDAKVASTWDNACKNRGEPVQKSWIALPAQNGDLYFIKAQGFRGSI